MRGKYKKTNKPFKKDHTQRAHRVVVVDIFSEREGSAPKRNQPREELRIALRIQYQGGAAS